MDDPQRLAELVTVAISTALMVLGAPPLAAMVKSWRYRNGSIKERRNHNSLSSGEIKLIVHEVDDCVQEAMKETLQGFKEMVEAIGDEGEKTRDLIRDDTKEIIKAIGRTG